VLNKKRRPASGKLGSVKAANNSSRCLLRSRSYWSLRKSTWGSPDQTWFLWAGYAECGSRRQTDLVRWRSLGEELRQLSPHPNLYEWRDTRVHSTWPEKADAGESLFNFTEWIHPSSSNWRSWRSQVLHVIAH